MGPEGSISHEKVTRMFLLSETKEQQSKRSFATIWKIFSSAKALSLSQKKINNKRDEAKTKANKCSDVGCT